MNTYEFITPSDPITFKTDDDKIAYVCAIILGEGKGGCTKITKSGEDDVKLPTMLLFASNPTKTITDYLGCEFPVFVDANKQKVKDCFSTFCYGSVSDRETFDNALEAITDPEKLKEFKDKYEDRNRTSMSAWVKYAWELSEKL